MSLNYIMTRDDVSNQNGCTIMKSKIENVIKEMKSGKESGKERRAEEKPFVSLNEECKNSIQLSIKHFRTTPQTATAFLPWCTDIERQSLFFTGIMLSWRSGTVLL